MTELNALLKIAQDHLEQSPNDPYWRGNLIAVLGEIVVEMSRRKVTL
jgi:hypothetical protein